MWWNGFGYGGGESSERDGRWGCEEWGGGEMGVRRGMGVMGDWY